ncbi:hypothetical protein SeMB42_g06677 [Synchytrium endobioticum]|uniref:N-acetyltransferase domain-containing protein n=1 Tax=Synchytrium endobioticum TaxID=286115 RepID=A0A507CFY9_9FUNG|nr:hypothetical protein SeMB42_g06677 [Synchytrium endobioticum]TPX45094.1 hypothetical protein SeLEV6574_g04084 [Synchytrium endobioticum]
MTQAQPSIAIEAYKDESQLASIMDMIEHDLSEPYTIYTYRYFLHQWPRYSFVAKDGNDIVAAVICRLDEHQALVPTLRGYIAMLAVKTPYRKRGIASALVQRAVVELKEGGADEAVLETEVTNEGALALYEKLGFTRDKRLIRYYLNGVDAFRLKLWLT